MGTQPTQAKPLRADAERNRRRLLDAARELFAARGLHVGLDEIARHAGVGVGTAYRRFPDKEALIVELFEDRADALVAALDEAAAVEDPREALRRTLKTFAASQAENRGLKELMFSMADHRGRMTLMRERVKPRLDAVVTRAQAAGVLREDLRTTDIALVNIMVGAIADATRDVHPEAWERALTIVLDGLVAAPDAATPLPGRPLADDDVQCALRASVARR